MHVQDRHHGEMELVFDKSLGLYAVIELPHHYYHDGVYVRIDGGVWYASTELNAGWKLHSEERLPPGLRSKYTGHGKRKHKNAHKNKHKKGRNHPAKYW